MQADSAHTILCNFHEDFKAETIAAELAEQGKNIDQILVQMLGSLKRTFSNDVRAVETDILENHAEYTIIKAAREGIYDMLPESLFHHPTAHKTARSEQEVIKAIKRRREEELNARKFFLPIEATINYLRIEMALYENRLDKRTHYDDLVQLFAGHWEIFQYLDPEQANIFLHLIPIIHDIRDDHPRVQEIMEMMFKEAVDISVRNQHPLNPDDTMASRLAESVLGVNLTTGNIGFDEGIDEIVIAIGPMESVSYREFMPGRRNARILQLLCDYLLPVHADIVTKFELVEKDRQARLADNLSDSNSVLGQDMVLCG